MPISIQKARTVSELQLRDRERQKKNHSFDSIQNLNLNFPAIVSWCFVVYTLWPTTVFFYVRFEIFSKQKETRQNKSQCTLSKWHGAYSRSQWWENSNLYFAWRQIKRNICFSPSLCCIKTLYSQRNKETERNNQPLSSPILFQN